MSKKKLLWNEQAKNILSVFWLRPFSAVIRLIEAQLLSLDSYEGSSLELACGDGIFSYLAKGGKLPDSFCAYKDIKTTHQYEPDSPNKSVDLFDQKISEFNAYPKQNFPLWDYGFDHKSQLLEKANQLNVFKNTHNLNFDDHEFKSKLIDIVGRNSIDLVFSNSLYWTQNTNLVLTSCREIMTDNATALFTLISPRYFQNMTLNRRRHQSHFANFLDRGRASLFYNPRSYEDWYDIFNNAGLEVVEAIPYFSDDLAICAEELDQRDIYPYFSKLYYSSSKEMQKEVKSEYMNHYGEMIRTFLVDYELPSSEENSCYFIFKCKKK